jgi:hypothetical protein
LNQYFFGVIGNHRSEVNKLDGHASGIA